MDFRAIDTTGEDDTVLVAVHDPRFGRISTVRLDTEQVGDPIWRRRCAPCWRPAG